MRVTCGHRVGRIRTLFAITIISEWEVEGRDPKYHVFPILVSNCVPCSVWTEQVVTLLWVLVPLFLERCLGVFSRGEGRKGLRLGALSY